eukprot:7376856-Prymnesium_polylepis.1
MGVDQPDAANKWCAVARLEGADVGMHELGSLSLAALRELGPALPPTESPFTCSGLVCGRRRPEPPPRVEVADRGTAMRLGVWD